MRLRREFGARVLLGRGEREGLQWLHQVRTDVPLTSLRELVSAGESALAERIRHYARAQDAFDPSSWEEPDGWLEAGLVDLGGRRLRVIPTPGHTRGHVVFLDEAERLLFAGDHVLPHITPSIGFELADRGLPLADFLDSLDLLLRYPDARLLPAHGDAGGGSHRRVAELLAHYADRLDDCRAVVEVSGGATAGEVARRLVWTGRRRRFSDLDDFNQMLAGLRDRRPPRRAGAPAGPASVGGVRRRGRRTAHRRAGGLHLCPVT